MQVHKPMLLGLGTRPIEYRKRFGLCISALLHFPFDTEASAAPTLWTEMSLWPFLAQEMPQGPLIDEGVAKLTPEFLVHGHAYAPPDAEGRRPGRCAVRATLAGVSKTLVASGARHWAGDVPSVAQPFERLALSWENAYGGPAFADNPVGKGAGGMHELPHLEYADQPLTHPRQLVRAAAMGRIDPLWPQRAQYRGTYDEAWYKAHAPAFAPDLDWRYFNLAPPDQWLPQPLRGDEPFRFDHMHPTRPCIEGRLPGFKARCFVQYRALGARAAALREVPLRLTTVWFFPHAERGVLIFQGLAETGQDDAADVAGLMGAIERLSQPRSDAHYAQAWERREDPVEGGLNSLAEADLLPEGLESRDPEFDRSKQAFVVEGLQAQAQRRRAELMVEEARADAQAAGKDPDALGLRMPEQEAAPTLENLAAYVREKNALAQKALKEDMERAARQILEAEEQAEREGVPLPPGRRGPPAYSAAAHLQELAHELPADDAAKRAERLREIAPRLVQLESAQRLGYLSGAHMQLPAPRLQPEEAVALRSQVETAHRQKMLPLAGLDFTGADLSGLDLRGADLSEAWLESADLRGTNLSGAKLGRAVLAHADLRGAIAVGADFSGANLGRAQLDGATLDAANLEGATLMYTQIGGAHLRRARLAGANLLNSVWGQADCTEAEAEAQNFIQLALGASNWAGALLGRANFIGCDLQGAGFQAAALEGASFVGCNARGIRLAQARLTGASFVKQCLMAQADLRGALADNANFGEAPMPGAQLQEASLQGANLRQTDLRGARLARASFKGALMSRARLDRADGRGANFMNAVMNNVSLRGADLRGSNLFAADLSRVRLDGDTRFDGALTARARLYPRLSPEQQAQMAAEERAEEGAA